MNADHVCMYSCNIPLFLCLVFNVTSILLKWLIKAFVIETKYSVSQCFKIQTVALISFLPARYVNIEYNVLRNSAIRADR